MIKSTKLFNKEFVNYETTGPGVYIYLNKDKNPIYVGKAINLKNRMLSYFSSNLLPKTRSMMENIKYYQTIYVDSEIDSLLLEANLIKKYKPKYNVIQKDDKRPLYIQITNDKYPRVLTVRKIDINKTYSYYGPFPTSSHVNTVLKIIRRTMPFSTHLPGKHSCFESQIGLCNPCPSDIEKLPETPKKELFKIYMNNIKLMNRFLMGDLNKIKNDLQKMIKKYSNNEDYENAIKYRNILNSINYVTSPGYLPINFLSNINFLEDIRSEQLNDFNKLINTFIKTQIKINRIECFDISHLSGSMPTASMITFIDGFPVKRLYRRFKIDPKYGDNDYMCLLETAKRRIKHQKDWGLSDIIIIDGGLGQIKQFVKVFNGINIPIIGIEKKYETLVIPRGNSYKKYILPNRPAKHLIVHIRNEAHRFAKKYHSLLYNKWVN